MPVVRLTARNVLSLHAVAGQRTDYRDEDLTGFVLRVSPAGSRTYSVTYFTGGRLKRVTIGPVGRLSLADARDLARRLLADVTKGADPAADKAARRGGSTFGELCDRFLDQNREKLRPTTFEGWERYVRVEVKPALGNKRSEDISRSDIRDFVRHFVRRGSPISGNRAYEVVRRVFSWATSEELVAASPCVGLRLDDLLADEKPRQRVYTNEEIRSIVESAQQTEYRDLVPLILHTTTRSEETRSARWKNCDLEARLWTIPPAATKTGEAHPVPLSKGALKVLARMHRESEFLFPAPTREGYMDPSSKVVQAIRDASGVADFGLHDLRRTTATRLAGMRNPPHIVDAILGHRAPGLTRTYQVYTPLEEMRAALEAWSTTLGRILKGRTADAKVVSLVRV